MGLMVLGASLVFMPRAIGPIVDTMVLKKYRVPSQNAERTEKATAPTCPAFERPGSRIDVTVSSIGDASSLQGGILLLTPLLDADGNVYAVAQGAVVLGGFSAGNDATGVTVNHPPVGRIANGASVERPVVTGLPQTIETLDLELDRTDVTNVGRVAQALNNAFGHPIALAVDG